MRPNSPVNFWTSLRLAAAALLVWGVALAVFIDIDKIAWHW